MSSNRDNSPVRESKSHQGCFVCGNKGRSAYTFACENNHQFPLHRTCMDFFLRCKICDAKMIAISRGTGNPLQKGKGLYKGAHTRHYRNELLSYDAIGQEVVSMGLAHESYFSAFHCMDFVEAAGVTREQYKKARREVQEKHTALFELKKTEIANWFSSKK